MQASKHSLGDELNNKIETNILKKDIDEESITANSFDADYTKPCRLMEDAVTLSTSTRSEVLPRPHDDKYIYQNLSHIKSKLNNLKQPLSKAYNDARNKVWPNSTGKSSSKFNQPDRDRMPFVWTGVNSRRVISAPKTFKNTTGWRRQAGSGEQGMVPTNPIAQLTKSPATTISAPTDQKNENETKVVHGMDEMSAISQGPLQVHDTNDPSKLALGDADKPDQFKSPKENKITEETASSSQVLALPEKKSCLPKSSNIPKWKFLSKCSVHRLESNQQVALASINIRPGTAVQAAQKHLPNLNTSEPADRMIGTIRVNNLAYEKSVIVRVTTDCWKTFRDYTAIYITSRSDSFAEEGPKTRDIFTFQLSLPNDCDRLEFAIQYTWGKTGGLDSGVDWDGNEGNNYVVVRDRRG